MPRSPMRSPRPNATPPPPGVRLGAIISIEEGGAYPPPRPMMRAEAMAADVPIAPGQTELSASVTITFALE